MGLLGGLRRHTFLLILMREVGELHTYLPTDPVYHLFVKLCQVDNCVNTHYARGWCNMHYQRWRKTGDPLYVVSPRANKTSFVKGQPSWNKGVPATDEAKERLRRANLGRTPWNKGRKMPAEQVAKMRRPRSATTCARIREARARQIMTVEHCAAIGHGLRGRTLSPEHVAKISGPNNYRWRGGQVARNLSSQQWRAIREAVLVRDGHRCTNCGKRRGLLAHHIVEYRDGGLDTPENLVTLCRGCHVTHHNTERRRQRLVTKNLCY